MENIRNFCIIAHIDHGKSTLADRLLEFTDTISERDMQEQSLDDMDLERERGITIKSHAIQMDYEQDGKSYVLNLIDTPGHVDFSYEVSRSIAACEGALLIVDATQGIQAQTISNLYLAIEHDLEIIPVLNKMDLDNAMPGEVSDQIIDLIGCDLEDIIQASGKTGYGVDKILEAVVERIPAPKGDPKAPFQALIFDSVFNSFRGIIAYFRILNGEIHKGDHVKFFTSEKTYHADEIGVLRMTQEPRKVMKTGDVGYIISGIKTAKEVNVGDTITHVDRPCDAAIEGFEKVKPMVFAGIYPVDADDYEELRYSLEKLQLNDASLTWEPESSMALGFGFRCGFLGLLHMEIIQERLENSGIRALNNVVDISNYLMLELGQPMHTFDYDKVLGAKMILRESKRGEKIITLDGQTRTLPDGAIIIEDGRGRIIDLCGIMGGNSSCVDENTTRIVLFVQIYDPIRIRKTTQKIAFRTEASSRFEKGMDPLGVIPALKQAAKFLVEKADGKIASKLIDIKNQSYEPRKIAVSIEQIENLLGVCIKPDQITQILKLLGFEIQWTTAPEDITAVPKIKITVPSWRERDIQIPEDIIEEVTRLYGYHKLPTNLPPLPKKLAREDRIFFWERKTRELLRGWGFAETYNYSCTSQEALEKAKFDPEQALKLKNPLTGDLTHLRPSLFPQLLETISKNQNQYPEQRLFQLSRVFVPQENNKLPQEPHRLIGLIYSTAEKPENLFYKAKGVTESLLKELGIEKASFRPAADSRHLTAKNFWQTGKSAEIGHKSLKIGTLGIIKSEILTNFELRGPLAAFNLDFDIIAKLATKEKAYEPIPKYPPIVEDITFEIEECVLAGEIKKEIQQLSAACPEPTGSRASCQLSAKIKSVYRDKKLEKEGRKAATFSIVYRSVAKNLSDDDIKPIRKEIIKTVKKKFGAKLRGESTTSFH